MKIDINNNISISSNWDFLEYKHGTNNTNAINDIYTFGYMNNGSAPINDFISSINI